MTQWPKSWSQTMAILRMYGYQDPNEYWICFYRENKREKQQYTRSGILLVQMNKDVEIAVIAVISLFII